MSLVTITNSPQNKYKLKMLLLIFLIATTTSETIKKPKCQQITIPMCKNIGYNFTQLPNSFNHDSQVVMEEAGLEVHQYWPLVEIKCSSDLKFFICSLYVPICMEDYKGTVPVCRSVCLRAQAGCEPVMTQYSFQWPSRFACTNFPPYGPSSICMDEKKGELPLLPSNKPPPLTPKNCTCSCKKPLIKVANRNVYEIENCTLPCQLYPNEKNFANYWLTFWASGCCGICAFTLVTFLVERGRFTYPERPIVYLSTCYLLISIGYLIRIYKGHEIACDNHVVKETSHDYDYCTLVFFLVYYFGLAAGFWWVALSISWYLAAGCKWGTEAITKKWPLFHLTAWVPPGVMTILARPYIDGDPVSGICFVGNLNEYNLYTFVIIPWGLLLVFGTWFLLGGFVELFRIRRVISKQSGGKKTEKLEKLMIRIGVFSILYTLPASGVIATQFYEINSKKSWIQSNHFCTCAEEQDKPQYSILMIKYFLSLAIGITTCLVWIWSNKTMETWKTFFCCKKSHKLVHV